MNKNAKKLITAALVGTIGANAIPAIADETTQIETIVSSDTLDSTTIKEDIVNNEDEKVSIEKEINVEDTSKDEIIKEESSLKEEEEVSDKNNDNVTESKVVEVEEVNEVVEKNTVSLEDNSNKERTITREGDDTTPSNVIQEGTKITVTVGDGESIPDLTQYVGTCTSIKIVTTGVRQLTDEDFTAIKNANMVNIDLSEASCVTLPANAFASYTALEKIIFPNNIKTIGENAFKGCTSLTGTLVIPGTVTTIGASAFSGCTGFTGNLTIPHAVQTIGVNAFEGWTQFNGDLTIGNSLQAVRGTGLEKMSRAANIYIGINKSHASSEYRKALVDAFKDNNLGAIVSLDVSNKINTGGSWLQSYTGVIMETPRLGQLTRPSHGNDSTTAILSIPSTGFSLDKVTVTKDGVAIALPQLDVSGKYIFDERGSYVVNITSNLGVDYEFDFVVKEFTGTVLVRYIDDETGAEILSSEIKSNLAHGSHTIDAYEILDYILVGDAQVIVEIDENNLDHTVEFRYKKDPNPVKAGSITVKFIDDETGLEIIQNKVFRDLRGGEYDVTAENIDGYELIGSNTSKVSVTFDNQNPVVEFRYKKIQTPDNDTTNPDDENNQGGGTITPDETPTPNPNPNPNPGDGNTTPDNGNDNQNGGTTEKPSDKPTDEEVTTSIGKAVNLGNSKLNIRKEATKDSDSIGSLKQGETFEILGRNGNWFKIKHNGIEGYVSATYVQVVSGEANIPNIAPPTSTPDNENNQGGNTTTPETNKPTTDNNNNNTGNNTENKPSTDSGKEENKKPNLPFAGGAAGMLTLAGLGSTLSGLLLMKKKKDK